MRQRRVKNLTCLPSITFIVMYWERSLAILEACKGHFTVGRNVATEQCTYVFFGSFWIEKNSCRLQERNSTLENALASCKREIPPWKMPLQVAREKFHPGKCSCRLQERNSTLENALAGCKRKIAQPKMLLQVAREKSLNRKCSCRLQEGNRSTGNALASCKRKIAQPEMLLQVAREASLTRKCNNIVVTPRGLLSPHPLGSFAYVSLRNHWNIAIRRQMFTLCMVQIHRKRVRQNAKFRHTLLKLCKSE